MRIGRQSKAYSVQHPARRQVNEEYEQKYPAVESTAGSSVDSSEEHAVSMAVVYGNCTASDAQRCIQTPHFNASGETDDDSHTNKDFLYDYDYEIPAGHYPSNVNCSFAVNDSATLYTVSFDLEEGYDFMYIKDVPYTGTRGPEDVYVLPSDGMAFLSDSSTGAAGFKICAVYAPRPPPPSPPSPQAPSAVSGNLANITDSVYASEQLQIAVEDESVQEVHLYTDVMLVHGQMAIRNTLMLLGHCKGAEGANRRCVMDAGSLSRAFAVEEGGELYLEQVEIRNGLSGSHGGAVHVAENGTAAVHDCGLVLNLAKGDGGAVHSEGRLVLSASDIDENSAEGFGGGIHCRNMSVLLVGNGTRIRSNKAKLGGGGIATMRPGTEVTVDGGSQVSGNECFEGEGGGILLQYHPEVDADFDGPLLNHIFLVDVEVSSNLGQHGGGGVFCDKGCLLTIAGSVISSNFATFNNGAGFRCEGSCVVNITNSDIAANQAQGGGGGGIYCGKNSTLAMYNSTVSYNLALGNGGGMLSASPDVSVSLSDCQLFGNIAQGSQGTGSLAQGGAVAMQDHSSLRLDNATVVRNNTVNIEEGMRKASAGGGGIYIGEYCVMTMDRGSQVLDNNSPWQGGGIEGAMHSVVILDRGSVVAGNTAAANGGGIMVGTTFYAVEESVNGTVIIRGGSQVSHNVAIIAGGGLYAAKNSRVTVENNSVLSFNRAGEEDSVYNKDGTRNGGGIYMSEDSALLIDNNSTVSNNLAQHGGGVYLHSRVSMLLDHGSALVKNNANESGGGLYTYILGTVTIANRAAVEHNIAKAHGGGIFAYVGAAVLLTSESSVNHNLAQHGGGGGIYGFAGYSADHPTAVSVRDRSVVANNSAPDQAWGLGGGICVAELSTIALSGHSEVSGNLGALGGGLFVEGSQVAISNHSMLRDNMAGHVGGNVYTVDVSMQLGTGCQLARGVSGGDGGGLWAHRSAVWTAAGAAGVRIVGSAAKGHGGGIFALNGTVRLADVEMVLNTAGYGGALWLQSAQGELNNTAVAGNSVVGSAGGLGVEGEGAPEDPRQGSRHAEAPSTLDMAACVVESNEADLGVGLLFDSISRTNVQLQNITFRHSANSSSNADALAGIGENIYWVVDSAEEDVAELEAPTCDMCVHPAGTELLRTSAVEYLVVQGAASTPQATMSVESGKPFDQLRLVTHDYYNHTAHFGSELYDNELGADFTGLELWGQPGYQFVIGFSVQDGQNNAVFESQVNEMNNVEFTVVLQTCRDGQQHDEAKYQCVDCMAGWVKFDNTTLECSVCDKEEVKCSGGNTIEVLDGYWMASKSIAANCGKMDTDCVLSRVYACDVPEACTTGDSYLRSNVATGEMYIASEHLCAVGYDSEVVLCGACLEQYQRASSGECERCRESSLATVLISLVSILVFAGVFIVCANYASRNKTVHEEEDGEPRFGQTVLTLLAGHIVIAGQQMSIFGRSAIPPNYRLFLSMFNRMTNVSFPAVLGVSCFYSGESFYFNFYCYSLLPVIFVLPIAYSWLQGIILLRNEPRLNHVDLSNLCRMEGSVCEAGPSASSTERPLLEPADHPPHYSRRCASFEPLMAAGSRKESSDGMDQRKGSLPDASADCTLGTRSFSGWRQLNPMAKIHVNLQHTENPLFARIPLDPKGSYGPGELSTRAASLLKNGGQKTKHAPAALAPKKIVTKAPSTPVGADDDDTPSARLSKTELELFFRQASVVTKHVPQEPSLRRATRMQASVSMSWLSPRLERSPRWRSASLMKDRRPMRVAKGASGAVVAHNLPSWIAAFVSRPAGNAGAINGVAVAFFFLLILHPTVSSGMIQLYNCDQVFLGEEEEAHFWMHSDRSIRCYDRDWYLTLLPVSMCVIVLYVLGLPISLAIISIRMHHVKSFPRKVGPRPGSEPDAMPAANSPSELPFHQLHRWMLPVARNILQIMSVAWVGQQVSRTVTAGAPAAKVGQQVFSTHRHGQQFRAKASTHRHVSAFAPRWAGAGVRRTVTVSMRAWVGQQVSLTHCHGVSIRRQ
ncbi:hypothetical protein CYMTET_22794, partial [Cymbomonas tetramitiformis]